VNAERTSANTSQLNMGLFGLKSDELQGMSFDSIDALAENGEPSATGAAW